jgi:myo-inositol-1(or 4)-monophosphatase
VNCSAAFGDHPLARAGQAFCEDGTVVDQGVRELVTLASEVARRAGETARQMRSQGVGRVDTKSTATDVVTAADKAVERQIVADLRAARPHDAVLGEEYGPSGGEPPEYPPGAESGPVRWIVDPIDGTTDYPSGGGPLEYLPGAESGPVRWIVDPIDGTVNYLYGLAHYAVSIAAEVGGRIVAGVVHNAATGDQWTATAGGGAWRQGRRLAASVQTDLGQALVGTGFGYDARRRKHQAAVLAGVLPRVRDIRRFGSAALDLAAAAEGTLDAFYEKGLQAWDLAAGGLIAREAGLLVTGLRGREAGPDMVLAAPPALHAPLHDLLAELDADGGF